MKCIWSTRKWFLKWHSRNKYCVVLQVCSFYSQVWANQNQRFHCSSISLTLCGSFDALFNVHRMRTILSMDIFFEIGEDIYFEISDSMTMNPNKNNINMDQKYIFLWVLKNIEFVFFCYRILKQHEERLIVLSVWDCHQQIQKKLWVHQHEISNSTHYPNQYILENLLIPCKLTTTNKCECHLYKIMIERMPQFLFECDVQRLTIS